MKQITLNIGGEDRVFYFGLGFLGNLLEKENIQMNEIDAKLAENPFLWIPKILYHSCAFGYLKKGEFAPFDLFDVSDWIDEVGMNSVVVTDFFKAFTQSLTKDLPDNKDAKKKVTKK
jgi:hypothetical protein